MDDVVNRHTAKDTVVELGDDLVALFDGGALKTTERAAVFLGDDDVVADIDQTASQITGVGRLHSRIGKTLTGTVRRNEVFEHRHTLLEVGENRVLNNLLSLGTSLLRLSHQTTHTGELLNLVFRTTGSRVEHHVNGVEALVGLGHFLQQDVAEFVVHMCPGIDNLIVAFVVGDETHVVVGLNLIDLFLAFLNDTFLLWRNNDIVEVEGQTCHISHAVTEVLDTVEELTGTSHTDGLDNVGNDTAQGLLRNDVVEEAYLVGNDAIDDDTADRCLHHVADRLAIDHVVDHHFHRSMKVALAFVMGNDGFFRTVERQSLALCTGTKLGDVVKTKHHVLRGHRDRCTVGWIQDVVAL